MLSVERDIILHLTRGGYLLSLADDAPQGDLPLVELQKFLSALPPSRPRSSAISSAVSGAARRWQRLLKPPGVTPPRHRVIVI